MNLFLYPDFDHNWKPGDQLICNWVVLKNDQDNQTLVLKVKDVFLLPAGKKDARPIIFVDTDYGANLK